MARVLGLLIVCVALLGVAWDTSPRHRNPSPPRPTSTTGTVSTTTTLPRRAVVAAIGDSNLDLVHDQLPMAVFEMDAYVESVVGLTANDALPATERALAHAPEAVVVVLGTNDARDAPTSGDDLAAVRAVADRLRSVPCVRWVTVNESSRFPSMNDQAKVLNAELRRLAAVRPGFGVIPWADELAAHPSWLQADGIHNAPEGRTELVARLATALRECVSSTSLAGADRR